MQQATTFIDGVYFGEGLRWHEGRLWFSDFYAPAVFAVGLDGVRERVVEVPQQPSGLGWLPDDRLLVVSMLDRWLLRHEATGLVEHADLGAVATFHCNDMVVDAQGRAYVGNFGYDFAQYAAAHGFAAVLAEPGPPTAALALVAPDGAVSVAATDLNFPNGMVISPDGATLIVAESFGRRLTAFAIAADGTLGPRRRWASTGDVIPDGICLDAAGAVWVANPTRAECIRFAEGGAILDRVQTSQPCYACALGGPDRTTLFLATVARGGEAAKASPTGRIEMARVAVPGAGLP